ncbi:hypothetical protein MRS44_008524 [Fusarium solani]|uniref:uncharacterized protein n=1 Tax=Fusarium solani TaxID=169388 RepID=UPI0032C42907|nr:hypothetical protein MRS44_008524 [Fusarium solani]
MPSWPSSTSSPENNEDEMPWHAAVLPALGFVKLTKMAMVVSPGWENWAWKRLQEVDPDFRKIRAIRDYTVTLPNYEQATTFPNEWKDETFFHNWMCVNIQPLLMCTNEGKLERAIHVLTNTDYVARWQAEKKKRKENLDKIERLRIKEEERLVKEQKREEEIRLKEIRSQRMLEKEENYE